MSVSTESSIPPPSIEALLEKLKSAQDGLSTTTIPRRGPAVPPPLPPRGGEAECPCEIEFRLQALHVIEDRGVDQFREVLKRREEDDAVLRRRRQPLHNRVQACRAWENNAFARFSKDIETQRTILLGQQRALEGELRQTETSPQYKCIPQRHPFPRMLSPPPGYPSPDSLVSAVESRPSTFPEATTVVRKQSQELDDDEGVRPEDMLEFEGEKEMPDVAAEEASRAMPTTTIIRKATPLVASETPTPFGIGARMPSSPGPRQRRLRALRPRPPPIPPSQTWTRRPAQVDADPFFSITLPPQFPVRPVLPVLPVLPTPDRPLPLVLPPRAAHGKPRNPRPRPRTQYLKVGGGSISVMLPALNVNISQIYHEAGEVFYRAAHRSIITAKRGGPTHNGYYVSLERAIFFCHGMKLHRIVEDLEQLRSKYCPDSQPPTGGDRSQWLETVLT
ncbi:hypothetical protein AYL99_11041 [Fonsecaea erecta]|uniref:Uncharacterized protein n=1 Tax=Fonsecaea erecta TaxID=1367422 RepID=A0A178Z5Z0_9EURO|nr:hypothetical protein AYL99_11041 [Fonsecaea erecta]OAP54593.1 hypothetical protein AYL99_11041 [Fonsecaea erecta]